jgi:hypothetical protein
MIMVHAREHIVCATRAFKGDRMEDGRFKQDLPVGQLPFTYTVMDLGVTVKRCHFKESGAAPFSADNVSDIIRNVCC